MAIGPTVKRFLWHMSHSNESFVPCVSIDMCLALPNFLWHVSILTRFILCRISFDTYPYWQVSPQCTKVLVTRVQRVMRHFLLNVLTPVHIDMCHIVQMFLRHVSRWSRVTVYNISCDPYRTVAVHYLKSPDGHMSHCKIALVTRAALWLCTIWNVFLPCTGASLFSFCPRAMYTIVKEVP